MISLVLIVAIPMMIFMPYLAKWMGLSQEVAGAWIGGTIDTTGAVVASGTIIGETAQKYAVIIKSAQNVLLGLAAFAISIYWSYSNKEAGVEKPTARVIWDRFPKFVIGFILASLLFSFRFERGNSKNGRRYHKGLPEHLVQYGFCLHRAGDEFPGNFQGGEQEADVFLPAGAVFERDHHVRSGLFTVPIRDRFLVKGKSTLIFPFSRSL